MKTNRENFFKLMIDSDMLLGRENILMACKSEEARQRLTKELSQKGELEYINLFNKYFDDIDTDILILMAIKNGKDELKKYKNPKTIADKKEKIKKLQKHLKGKKIFRVFEQLDNENNKIILQIYDTEELVEDKKPNGDERMKSFEQLVNDLETISVRRFEESNIKGSDLFFGVIPRDELIDVYTVQGLSDVSKFYSYNKIILNDFKRNSEELIQIRNRGYLDLLQFIEKEPKMINNIYNSIIQTIEELKNYVDFDKLILRGAYRLERSLEEDSQEENNQEQYLPEVKQILEKIVNYYDEKNTDKKAHRRKKDIKYQLSVLNDEDKFESITYSLENVKQCIKKFRNDKYYTQNILEERKENAQNGELLLQELNDENILDLVFKDEQLKDMLFSNDENYKFIKEKMNLSNEQIIEISKKQGLDSAFILNILISENIMGARNLEDLYNKNIITGQTLAQLISERDSLDIINYEKVITGYEEAKISEENQKQYDKYMEFCRIIAREETKKSDENSNISSISEKLMENLADSYDIDKKEDYLEKLEFFYTQGLLDIRSIISWEDDGIISQFYNDGVININTLKSGIIPEKYIVKAYINDKLSREDIEELIVLGVVDKNNNQIKEKNRKGFSKRVEEAFGFSPDSFKFNENAKRLGKNKSGLGDNLGPDSYMKTVMKDNRPVVIIDPDFREEYIKLFGAVEIELPVDKYNSFYNYKSYVLPDEYGELGENSVVIAERYFEDKNTQRVFATDNATYFFKFGDLVDKMSKKSMRYSEYKKSLTVYHNLGKWGKNIIKAVAQTMLGDDLKGYSKKEADKIMLKKLQEVYTIDELANILEMAGEIDRGDFDCEIYEEER